MHDIKAVTIVAVSRVTCGQRNVKLDWKISLETVWEIIPPLFWKFFFTRNKKDLNEDDKASSATWQETPGNDNPTEKQDETVARVHRL